MFAVTEPDAQATRASLSGTLKRFVDRGIIDFENGPHRTRIPALIAHRVHLDIDLTGHHSTVAVERPR
jgi:predicted transcriptional regulator